jgi:hypothetical protein
MKKVVIIFFILLVGSWQIYAQDSLKLKSFKEKVLPQYNTYFNQASLSDNGLLKLIAVDKYVALTLDEKKAIVQNITPAWREPLILVTYGTRTEMWGWNVETGNTQLLDVWDLNPLMSSSSNIRPKANTFPWFMYGGFGLYGDGSGAYWDINLSIGCYLLRNRWDFGYTLSFGNAPDSNLTFSIGLISRVHFPIKKSKIVPNIGGQLMLTYNTAYLNPTINEALVFGISWFVGVGSINLDLSLGSSGVAGLGGYTIAPNLMKQGGMNR